LKVDWVAVGVVSTLVVSVWNSLHIKKIHVIINSRMSQLLKKTDVDSREEGRLEGIAEEKERPHG
jgi:hypothetical protein